MQHSAASEKKPLEPRVFTISLKLFYPLKYFYECSSLIQYSVSTIFGQNDIVKRFKTGSSYLYKFTKIRELCRESFILVIWILGDPRESLLQNCLFCLVMQVRENV